MKLEKHTVRFPIYWPRLEDNKRHLMRLLLPTPGNVLFTLLVVGGLLWATSAGALPFRAPTLSSDSTTTISYQGRLADSSGAPVTTSGVGMQFRLYNTDTGGSPLWEERHTAVPVEDGLFHVLLGSTDPIPVLLLANNSTLWLGITVGADSEMTPREQIASVPYAMIASTVPDGSITTEQIADGAVTTGKLSLPFAEYRDFGWFSTTSSDYVPIPGAEVTIDLDVTSKLLVVFAGDISVDTDGCGAIVTVAIDGQLYDLPQIVFVSAPKATRVTGSQSMIVEVGPGSHVIQLNLRSYGVTTALIGHRSLSVLAFH